MFLEVFMNRINIAILGDFFADTRFALSLANENDNEKMMYCVFANGRAACRVNLAFVPELNADENHIFVESIELTSANRDQREEILNELIDDDARVSEILTQLDSQRYSKLALLNTLVETDKLKEFLFNNDFSSNINEITICFKISELIYHEISANGYDSISLRSVYDTVYYPQGSTSISTESLSHFHYAMQKSDVFIIADSPFYSSFTNEQIELLKPYIKAVPVVAFNSESDLLLDMLEDINDIVELKNMYRKNSGKVKCRNTNRLLKRINIGNAFCDIDGNVLSIGCTSGDDGKDIELYNKLIAFSIGLICEKINDFNFCDLQTEISFSDDQISVVTSLADNENAIIDFLKSDKPLIHANGGIAIKNHGKYKFKESCILAVGLYKYLDSVIDNSAISETDKFRLHNKLLRSLDSYAFYDGHKLLNRKMFVEAAEAVRASNKKDVIIELARYAVNYLN